MRLLLLTMILPIFLLLGCGVLQPVDDGSQQSETVEVSRVIDGDTVEVRPRVQGTEDVRLIGIDTPETGGSPQGPQPYGEKAAEFAERRLEGREVELEFDEEKVDDYGRALAYLYLPDGTMFNEVLLEKGYAQVATFPPNVEYLQEFGRAQKEARRNERGIWGLPEDKLCRLTDRGNGIGGSCQSVSTG